MPLWRRAVGHPLVWAGACAAVALPFFLRGEGLDLFPFLLALVAGWLSGTAFVNATSRLTPRWRGAVVNVAGGVLGAALVVWSLGVGESLLAAQSVPVRGVVLLVQIAATPGVCWVWLGILARGIELLPSSKRSSRR